MMTNEIFIVTLTEYQTNMTEILNRIELPELKNKTVIIDTAIYTGLNDCRFIQATLNDQGRVSSHRYTAVSNKVEHMANRLFKRHFPLITKSVLTQKQIKKIKSS